MKILKNRTLRKAFLHVLSCVVVFLVFLQLVLPAIAIDTETALNQPGFDIEETERLQAAAARTVKHVAPIPSATFDIVSFLSCENETIF